MCVCTLSKNISVLSLSNEVEGVLMEAGCSLQKGSGGGAVGDWVLLAIGRGGMGQPERQGKENLKDLSSLEETYVSIIQLNGDWGQGSRGTNVVRRLLPVIVSRFSTP